MRLNKHVFIVAVAGLVLSFTAPASAQGYFNFGYTHFGGHSGFGVGFSVPFNTYYYPHRHYYSYPAYPSYPVDSSYSSYPVVTDRVWVPGHWDTRDEQVWIPGSTRRVWVEPTYESVRDPAGNVTRVMTREGYWKTVQDPGRYETRRIRIWIPGQYV